MNGLRGKNILVTGSTSGIGQAIAVRFAAEGSNVAINYRKQEEDAAETNAMLHESMDHCVDEMKGHGVNHILVQADVSKEDEVKRMVQEPIDGLGGLDFLINNAGIQIPADSHEMTTDNFDTVLGVNLRGSFIAARATIHHFLAEDKSGVIINVSSVHQQIPKPRFLSYPVSKGGMMNLPRTLSLEYAGRKIRVNGIGLAQRLRPSIVHGSTIPKRRAKPSSTSPWTELVHPKR